jgi:hypothetical protein
MENKLATMPLAVAGRRGKCIPDHDDAPQVKSGNGESAWDDTFGRRRPTA